MTQEQEDRFFKKIKVDFRSRISGGICNLAPVYNEDELKKIESEYKKMFLVLVEVLYRQNGIYWIFAEDEAAIESASGLPWPEVKKIYEECVNGHKKT
ncbi:MAG: hypothetical protein PVG39_01410 [Desulfobacteraceae bacterium]|jgi:hypothetical protein